MDEFIKQFRREAPGVWVCVQPATLNLPEGRIQVAPGTRFTTGTRFMNVELARLLDEHYRRMLASE
jgi:hypothetical protein